MLLENNRASGGPPHPCVGLFDRMRRRGQPPLAKILGNEAESAHWWAQAAKRFDPRPCELSSRSLWRLLDPTHLYVVDIVALENSVPTPPMTAPEPHSSDFQLWLKSTEGPKAPAFRPRDDLIDSLAGLEWDLLQLRKAEVVGNLLVYYLRLLDALDRCSATSSDPCLEAIRADCHRVLVGCYGRVHVVLRKGSGWTLEETWQRMKEAATRLGHLRIQERSHWHPMQAEARSSLAKWHDAISSLVEPRSPRARRLPGRRPATSHKNF
jgi:hypothetical protein